MNDWECYFDDASEIARYQEQGTSLEDAIEIELMMMMEEQFSEMSKEQIKELYTIYKEGFTIQEMITAIQEGWTPFPREVV